MEEATVLAEGYKMVAQSLSLVDAAEHIPRIMDQESPEDNADFKDYNTNPRIESLVARQPDAEPLVNSMITLFKQVEDISEEKKSRPQSGLNSHSKTLRLGKSNLTMVPLSTLTVTWQAMTRKCLTQKEEQFSTLREPSKCSMTAIMR